METALLIEVDAVTTRVALVAAGMLQEVHIEKHDARGVLGNIYQGRVARMLPGMQAAFVDIGLDRPGFLKLEAADPPRPGRLHEGQKLLVQVAADPIGDKGARLTERLSLAAHTLVMTPGGTRIGASRRIADPAERARLQDAIAGLRESLGIRAGFIARTCAGNAPGDRLEADMRWLQGTWTGIEARSRSSKAGQPVHEELPLDARAIRDLASAAVTAIHVNDSESETRLHELAGHTLPELAERMELHPRDVRLFERFGVEDQVRSLLDKRVPLPSGGHLVIESTEAMTAIDINSGRFLSGRSLEHTALTTNTEAAREIPRQLRLRNIGGVVVVDFIEMHGEENRRTVLDTLEDGVAADANKVRVTPFSVLGLVEMSRQRTRASLSEILQ